MNRVLVLFLVTLGSLAAQVFGPGRLPANLVSYLELTGSQQQQIVQANLAFQNFSVQKQRRITQVQTEIAIETAKPDLDPMALGMRYRELEAIRRETTTEKARAVETVQAILTAAQKQKLGVLQEALRIQSTACDAVNWNLMTYVPVAPFPTDILGPVGGIAQILVPNLIFNTTCGVTGGVRTGDFLPMPMPMPVQP